MFRRLFSPRRLHAAGRAVVMLLFVAAMLGNSTAVRAGTTGSLTGTVTDSATHQPIPGAKISATSPSQSASATTDGAGRFSFLALPPDTYTITVTAAGYDVNTVAGATVIADNPRTIAIVENKALRTIGKVTSRSAAELVKPGTSADVYSVNATVQEKSAVLGGGGNLDSAFSALAAVPGVFVQPGQAGYQVGVNEGVNIRGGDVSQIGYEIDGVPVNRAFDSAPSGPASSLGQQELQVYTGAAPPAAEAQGLSGFVNQVIKTGTYPATTTLTGALGGPAYYHKVAFETGGASESRNFSYYIGVGGYNQQQRFVDQYNGAGVSQLYGVPIASCSPKFSPAFAPSCYTGGAYNGNTGIGSFVLGDVNLFQQAQVADRDTVANVHFAFPHKNGTKDDVQLLYVNNFISTSYLNSANDQGGLNYLSALGVGTTYASGLQYNGAVGVPLPTNYQALTVPYGFPQAGGAAQGGTIPVDVRDGLSNDQGIFKLQYTHAIGTQALLKLYGYTYYSDYLYKSPNSENINYYGNPGDYSLASHTRGLSGTFTDQIGSANVLTLQASYTLSTTLRDNNSQFGDFNRTFGAIVNSADPLAGYCYGLGGGAATTCAGSANPKSTAYNPALTSFRAAANGSIPAIAPGATCGSGPCEYLVVENGLHATYNTVKPKFSAISLTDQWKPTSKLSIDAGIRFDRFEYDGSNTTGTPARTFWYNAYNLDNCVAPGGAGIIARAPGAPCTNGATPAHFTNPSGIVIEGYNEYQPRIGFTYSLAPTTVIRGSYGRFTQAPSSAFQQYNVLQQDAPAQLYDIYGFQKFGFTTPNHDVVPPTSNNLDFSLEHQFNSDTSVKLTPFYRTTQNQIQDFYLNQQTGFTSGLNVGHQVSEGFEFELDKGNFARNGIAAKLALAYTNSYVNYGVLSNGSTIIDPLNAQIKSYNAYTSFCVTHPTVAACAGAKTSSGVAAAPCYTTGGAADPACAAGSVANPYWNSPAQGLLETNGRYPTFDYFPAGIGSYVQGFGAPYTGTLLVQYKHDRLAVTPALQFFGGQRYGAPATSYGVAPDTCKAVIGSTAGDPRYPNGAPGGSAFDYASCAGQLPGGIPDPYTGKFDSIGNFVQPSQFVLNLQLSYDVSKRVSITANLANIVNRCFGGSKTGFTVTGACTYALVANGSSGDVGNLYNPGSAVQPYVNTPYEPTWTNINPFGIYVNARVKI